MILTAAFVYGTYTITELKTEATRNMKMYTKHLHNRH